MAVVDDHLHRSSKDVDTCDADDGIHHRAATVGATEPDSASDSETNRSTALTAHYTPVRAQPAHNIRGCEVPSTKTPFKTAFDVTEVAEAILKELDFKSLFKCQMVSRRFKDIIRGSLALQRALFYCPAPDDGRSFGECGMNPFLTPELELEPPASHRGEEGGPVYVLTQGSEIIEGTRDSGFLLEFWLGNYTFLRDRDASWRRMYPCHPAHPCIQGDVLVPRPNSSDWYRLKRRVVDGQYTLTMGELVDNAVKFVVHEMNRPA